jgi:hypothetical protein
MRFIFKFDKDLLVLEPGVGEIAIDSSHDTLEMVEGRVWNAYSAGKVLVAVQ